jgi:hypothetical protein
MKAIFKKPKKVKAPELTVAKPTGFDPSIPESKQREYR